MPAQPLFEDTFLRAQWSTEFDAFEASSAAADLLARLRNWASRDLLNERASETAFIQRFLDRWNHFSNHRAKRQNTTLRTTATPMHFVPGIKINFPN